MARKESLTKKKLLRENEGVVCFSHRLINQIMLHRDRYIGGDDRMCAGCKVAMDA